MSEPRVLYTAPPPVGMSARRMECIVELVATGSTGEFAIVHQDKCRLNRTAGQGDCTCVASVFKIERGRA